MTRPDPARNASAYLERLRSDPGEVSSELRLHPERLVDELHARYPFFPRTLIHKVIDHFRQPPLVDNPLAMRYLDSEFAIVDSQLELMRILEDHGRGVRGRSVLDIGCSNGALLCACLQHGAARCVGVDIDDARLANARELLSAQAFASKVEVTRANLLEEDLPARLRPFQVVLSTNVLEHVPSVPKFFDAVRRHLSEDRDSYGMMVVGNKYNLTNVLSEPHYGIPGMVLLPREEASRIWEAERTRLSSDQPYEVFDWYLFEEYRSMAQAAGLEADLLLDEKALSAFDVGKVFPEEFVRKYRGEALESLGKLGLSAGNEEILRGALDAFFEEFLRDHREAAHSPALRRQVFIKYHVFLFRLLLTYPGARQHWWRRGRPAALGRWLHAGGRRAGN